MQTICATIANGSAVRVLLGQTRQFSGSIDVIAPGAIVSMIVPVAVFFAFQRYFVQGLLAGVVEAIRSPNVAVW